MSRDTIQQLQAALAGRYQIGRQIGQGGMAAVYLAYDLKHDRQVALKVLRPELAAALGSERFLQTTRVAAQVTHRHILPLYDAGEADGFLYSVMAYVQGESLRARLTREHQLPVQEVARIVHQLAHALSHAHRMGVVHGDLKPENVLFAGRRALVTDFGLAVAVTADDRERLTAEGISIGTPAYLAPEQAADIPHTGPTSDLYALGVMAYEMLVGLLPFGGATALEMQVAKLTATPAPISEFRVWAGTLQEVITQCLRPRPEDRWRSAEEVLPHLEAIAGPAIDAAMLRRPSVLLLIGANSVPLIGIPVFGWRTLDLLLLFWLENIVVGLFSVARMAAVAPLDLRQWGTKLYAIPLFLLVFAMFTAFHGAVIVTLFGGGFDFVSRRLDEFGWTPMLIWDIIKEHRLQPGLLALGASHGFSFAWNYLAGGEFRKTTLEKQSQQPFLRLALLQFAVILGVFLVAITRLPPAALAVLVALKTGLDVWLHLLEHAPLAASTRQSSGTSLPVGDAA